MTDIEIRGLQEAIQKYKDAPQKLRAGLRKTMFTSLDIVHENVKPYPPPPTDSSYRRTGTLGRTLGASRGGALTGSKPDIYRVQQTSADNMTGYFGTKLDYAPYVIGGAQDDPGQAWMHKSRWWTIDDVAEAAKEKVQAAWNELIKRILK
jgi:hypothetical protein